METLLRKYMWVLDLDAIVVVAVFAARSTALMLDCRLARRTPTANTSRQSAPANAFSAVGGKQVENILKRNVFCSSCPVILPGAVKQSSGPLIPEPVATKLPLKLMAIMFSLTALVTAGSRSGWTANSPRIFRG